MYDRIKQWNAFNNQVRAHIQEYTLAQYGNPEGDEQVDSFTPEDCFKNLMRYVNRRNSCTRGTKERLRDVIKIAHYASFIYDKLRNELAADNVYEPWPWDKDGIEYREES